MFTTTVPLCLCDVACGQWTSPTQCSSKINWKNLSTIRSARKFVEYMNARYKRGKYWHICSQTPIMHFGRYSQFWQMSILKYCKTIQAFYSVVLLSPFVISALTQHFGQVSHDVLTAKIAFSNALFSVGQFRRAAVSSTWPVLLLGNWQKANVYA